MSRRLERLQEQRWVLEARIKEARAQERVRVRKEETRKKIVVGAYFLDQMEENPALEKQVLDRLRRTLKRTIDRELFGFAPIDVEDAEGREDTR